MKCPHCLEVFRPVEQEFKFGVTASDVPYRIRTMFCPGCSNPTVFLRRPRAKGPTMIFPRASARAALPSTVPDGIAEEFREACEVFAISPKASAALSRRMLQRLLREYGKFKERTLEKEIDKAIPTLPGHLADAIDAVRHVGNIAAHPIHSGSTGEIVDVDEGEAEWLLDTVEALIDFYVVQPAILATKRDALNKKLADANKPPLKGDPADVVVATAADSE